MGGAVGQLAGRLAGTVIGGGKIDPTDVKKSVTALAAGTLLGKGGGMIARGLGALVGEDQETAHGGGGGGGGDGGGGSAGGAVTVSGAGVGEDAGEHIRLLREIAMNMKVLVNDGISIKAGFRRAAGSAI